MGKKNLLFGRVITLNNVSERVRLYQKVKEASLTDSLTGVLNRRAFIEKGESEINRTIRHERDLSVIMMDVDNFKTINDKYGHRIGDNALCTIAQLCHQQMRSTDEMARYGGDEFAILLPETNAKDAFILAKRICRDVAEVNFSTEMGERYSLSISVGVAEFIDRETLGALLHRADEALYEAKRLGKNQAVQK